MKEQLIKVDNLKKYFDVPDGLLHAVDDVSFTINRGETLGLVGESGCGKSTIGRVLLRLLPATDGKIQYNGKDILSLSKSQMNEIRKEMQIIFQDPYSSLDSRKTVSQIIREPLMIHKTVKKKEMNEKVLELMERGGIKKRLYHSYPHELDGGRRQRVGIIRALALDPNFIVCDEPVSSLDVSIQAQILNLLQRLQVADKLTYLFISHDLSVVKHISNRIMVMYLGQIIEVADSKELFNNTAHPYTKALISAIPIAKYETRKNRIIIKGDVPSPVNPEPGCRFAPRCWMAEKICTEITPKLQEIAPNHSAACHLI